MGLAEPRKRLKLSHDPNNTAWTSQASFGSTLMQKSGWTPGTALGASSVPIPVSQSTASQVKIRVKDDTLGLGASLKSRDVEGQRTGLDAFQGLLGRLNAKDAQELEVVETKIENRKLEVFARGRWGGMMFVRGGVLVQEDPKTKIEVKGAQDASNAKEDKQDIHTEESSTRRSKTKPQKNPNETPEERTARKAAESQRKQEKRARKEARRLKKLQKSSETNNTPSASASETPDITESSTGASTPTIQIPPGSSGLNITSVTQSRLKNGRHILRGRNIQAKKMAFSDARGLDQIFMKRQEREQEV